MTTYSKRYPMNAGIKPGPIPTTWNYLNSYIISSMFTAPEHNWYKIFVWGGSGAGQNGIAGTEINNSQRYGGVGGRGGNSGGFSAHQVWLKKGTTVPINISSGTARVGVSGTDLFIQCTNGGNTASSPGTASGGNLANLSGAIGGAGGTGGSTASSPVTAGAAGQIGGNNGAIGGDPGPSGSTPPSSGGGGGGGAKAVGDAYASKYLNVMGSAYSGGRGGYAANSNPPKITIGTAGSSMASIIVSSSIKITGAGSGGGGGSYQGEGGAIIARATPGAGGSGQGAAVIIEQGVKT